MRMIEGNLDELLATSRNELSREELISESLLIAAIRDMDRDSYVHLDIGSAPFSYERMATEIEIHQSLKLDRMRMN